MLFLVRHIQSQERRVSRQEGQDNMINTEERRSGHTSSVSEDLRKCEVMSVESEAWNIAWNIELGEDGTTALSPGCRGSMLTSSRVEPSQMSCKNQPMFPNCPLKSESTNGVLLLGALPEAGLSLSYRPLLSGMARPLYQDRSRQRAGLVSSQSRQLGCLSGLALMQ